MYHILVKVDGSTNILLLSTFRNMGILITQLTMSSSSLVRFNGDSISSQLIRVGLDMIMIKFFIVDINSHYNLILERIWIC